ncbi:hypothetical protein IQ238_13730 [Pleurocapsales cyanobacterium LEGE 06147]|nr:hypothetical protein [Pleurocapsales cyanobacterium LEGE 06147]
MNRIALLMLVGILTILLDGCSLIADFFNSDRQEETTTANKPQSQNNKAKEKQQEQAAQESEELLVSKEVAGLIPATNPEARVRGSIRGRHDPFATISLKPQIRITQEENQQQEDSSNITSTPTIESLENEPTAESWENEPKVVLAEEVIITGVVEVGGITNIIVRAPEEPSSRYVQVGQYLSNGRILVKRVESSHSPTPLVILEQDGIEIAKAVGEIPQTETSPEGEQAFNSMSKLPSTSASWVSNFLSQQLHQ